MHVHIHTHSHAHTHTHTQPPGLKEGSPRDEVVRFLEQATAFRGIEHPNLQPVLRVSVEDNIVPLVIYPIVEYGNMHSFLHHCRIAPEESPINVRHWGGEGRKGEGREEGREGREERLMIVCISSKWVFEEL